MVEVEVKETDFQFGRDSTTKFLQDNKIESTDHVVFDEVVCLENNQNFVNSLCKMKKKLSSSFVVWLVMKRPRLSGYMAYSCLIGK